MKITPKQYAVLLYEIVKSAPGKNIDKEVRQFLKFLIENRDLSLLPRIELLFKDYFNKRENAVDIDVVSARELPKKVKCAIEKSNLVNERKLASTRAIVGYSVDPAVIGGVSVKVGDYMIDYTIKTRLTNLERSLIK